MEVSPTAALVLASAAAEVGLKSVLLKPVVAGLVHTEALAGHIANLAVQQQDMDRFRDLLFEILREFGGVDLSVHQRPNAAKALWKEIEENSERRNALVHRCSHADGGEAALAISVAEEVLEGLFPKVAKRLRLHLHEGYRTCDRNHELDEVLARIRQ